MIKSGLRHDSDVINVKISLKERLNPHPVKMKQMKSVNCGNVRRFFIERRCTRDGS
jgi:hypothetical protein